jgi:WASH complex subunit strumpellin
METTVLGGIEVHPHKLVDEGLRKELVSHVSGLLNNLLQFDFSADSETVSSMSKHLTSAMKSLASLSERFEAFRMSLECVDDYLRMHGLKMWHEEMGRIVNYNVEQEVRGVLSIVSWVSIIDPNRYLLLMHPTCTHIIYIHLHSLYFH